jgi:cation diffusion facilitator CzcD-associated flavoprotein CzcO
MHRVAIIGAGLSGICAAARLKAAGIEDFVMLDRAEAPGGTWRDNTYPGCACDIPSVLYSFSFAPHPDWSRTFAPQPEIQRYLLEVARDTGALEHFRGGCEVTEASWTGDHWRLETSEGTIEAKSIIAGTGPWHEPVIPDLPGLAGFEGDVFHSSRWDHDVDLRGRRIAVIGTGASAVQFVPEIAPDAEHLTLFQRTAHWVLPKPDRRTSRLERSLYRRFPITQRVMRVAIFSFLEIFNAAMHHPRVMRRIQRLGERNIERAISDPGTRADLTPSYTLGCKRVLMSNDWYPTLARENVIMVPRAVSSVTSGGVIDSEGTHHEADVLILGTGFKILDMPIAGVIRDARGRTLAEAWEGSPRAYLGTSVAGFPNAYLMLGPNIGINTSATVLMEAQADYIVEAIRTVGDRVAEVRPEIQDRFNERVDAALAGTVWNNDCRSYFIDSTGRNGFSYPWSARDLERRLRTFRPERYVLSGNPVAERPTA